MKKKVKRWMRTWKEGGKKGGIEEWEEAEAEEQGTWRMKMLGR